MWELIRSGNIMMIPIILCSLIGLAIFVERLLTLRRHRIIYPEIAEAVETLAAGNDYSVAYAICERKPGAFANLVRTGLDHAEDDWEIIQQVLQEAGRQEGVRLIRHLGILETVAAVAPLLGLLGTVTGMIRVFSSVSAHGLGYAEHLSGGISEAMITTAAGLMVGIPALVGHNWLEGRAKGIIFELECYATKVLDTLRRRQPMNSAPAPGLGDGTPAGVR
ncbi:MAG: MotA/TolQ/ExbB proton channel family protein [bacterium]